MWDSGALLYGIGSAFWQQQGARHLLFAIIAPRSLLVSYLPLAPVYTGVGTISDSLSLSGFKNGSQKGPDGRPRGVGPRAGGEVDGRRAEPGVAQDAEVRVASSFRGSRGSSVLVRVRRAGRRRGSAEALRVRAPSVRAEALRARTSVSRAAPVALRQGSSQSPQLRVQFPRARTSSSLFFV